MPIHSTLTGTELHDPLGSSRVGTLTLATNTANAMLWQNGANPLLAFDTTTSAVAMRWGNTTDNPTYTWLGSGLATFHGNVAAPTVQATDSTGTNTAGNALALRGGLATGNAVTGDVVFYGADAGTSGTTPQTAVERARLVGQTGAWRVTEGEHGQYVSHGYFEEVVSLSSGVHVDTVGTIPANAIVLVAMARVTTTITGPANWKYGKATDSPPNRYGASLALSSGTTSTGLDSNGGVQQNASAVAIRIQAQDDTTAFTGGAVRVSCHYLTFQVPTS